MDSAKKDCEYRRAGYQVRKLEEGERRGTLRKEAVGLGRDASPSSDNFPSCKKHLEIQIEGPCALTHSFARNRIMLACDAEFGTAKPKTHAREVPNAASGSRVRFRSWGFVLGRRLVNGSRLVEFGCRARPHVIPKRRCGSEWIALKSMVGRPSRKRKSI